VNFIVENPEPKKAGFNNGPGPDFLALEAFLKDNPDVWVKLEPPTYSSVASNLKRRLRKRNPGKEYATTCRLARLEASCLDFNSSRTPREDDPTKVRAIHWIYVKRLTV
jgi:hypothetical protein